MDLLQSPSGKADLQQPLGDAIYERLRSLIVDGTLVVASRLPSEAELGRQFSVSRPVVRQALAKLRADGYIASRKGSGSYVQHHAAPETPSSRVSSIAEMQECHAFRMSLEGEIAAVAASNRSELQLREMRAILDVLDRDTTVGEAFEEHDFAFHMKLAEATHNSFFIDALKSISEQVHVSMTVGRLLAGRTQPDRSRAIARQHQLIYDGVAAGDPEAARQAMRAHLDNARRRILTGKLS